MELTPAQQIFLKEVNQLRAILGEAPITTEEFLEEFSGTDTLFIFKAMDSYGRAKWEEACKAQQEMIAKAMSEYAGDSSFKDVFNQFGKVWQDTPAPMPEFKP